MRFLQRAAILIALVGCGGDDGGNAPPPDTQTLTPDSSTTTDGPPSNACTGKAYDPCTDNSQCMSGNCHLYAAQGLQVCTTSCTAGNNATCPVDKTGANGLCNNMSICRPAAANDCTR
jgi:hypothetical protein